MQAARSVPYGRARAVYRYARPVMSPILDREHHQGTKDRTRTHMHMHTHTHTLPLKYTYADPWW